MFSAFSVFSVLRRCGVAALRRCSVLGVAAFSAVLGSSFRLFLFRLTFFRFM
ncbi:hypothetical protein AB0N81_12745 [Streptomyces sp. NPDC093510]|uniref:hypothetical protein n=1 Tax=Streptomyces sp. NPDC093510 TaxID=3155199 RepID=UPI0034360A8D